MQLQTYANCHAKVVEVARARREQHMPTNIGRDRVPALQQRRRIVDAVNHQKPPIVRAHPFKRGVPLLSRRLVKDLQPERPLRST